MMRTARRCSAACAGLNRWMLGRGTGSPWRTIWALVMIPSTPVGAQCEFAQIWTTRGESSGFTRAIAIGSDFAAIAAPRDTTTNPEIVSGAVYIYSGMPGLPWTWVQTDLLAPPSGVQFGEEFGWSLALDGDLLVVGARKGDALPDSQINTGAVYIYQRNPSGQWDLLDVATASTYQQDEKLGETVAISGQTIFAGSISYNRLFPIPVNAVGRVVIFEPSMEDPTQWVEVQAITPNTLTEDANFGYSIAAAGNTLVVGAPKSDELFDNAGAAFVYERNAIDPTQWDLLARLAPADLAANDQLGWAVETDGQKILVGARQKNSVAVSAGRVYVYRRDPASGDWLFDSPTIIDPPSGTSNRARFGSAISLRNELAFIGAPAENNPNAADQRGTVFVYARSGPDSWTLLDTLRPDNLSPDSDFGMTLDSRDGLLVVGDPNWNADAGAPPLGMGLSYWYVYETGAPDCDSDGISDTCEVATGAAVDCDLDGVPDVCPGLPIAVWTAEFKGIFSDPNSWCADLPTPVHNVIFLNEAPDGLANEVIPIHDHTIRGLEVRRGWYELLGNLGSISLRDPGAVFAGNPMRIGVLPEHARLDVTDTVLTVGDDLLLGSTVLAVVPGSSAEMHVSGSSALLDVSLNLVIADEGPATFTASDGAIVHCAELRVGSRIRENAVGTLRLPTPANIDIPAPELHVDVQARVERGTVEIGRRSLFDFRAGGGLIIERDGVVRSDAILDGDVTNIGTLGVLSSPRRLLVRGTYNQFQGDGSLTQIGRLSLNLGSGTDPSDIDFLEVTQAARLNGGLIITAAPGFDPPIDTRFEIIRAGSLDSGRFSVASFPAMSGLKYLQLEYDETTDIVAAVVASLNSNQDSSFGDSQGYSVSASLRDAALGSLTDDGTNSYLDLVAVAAGETVSDPGALIIFHNTGQSVPEDPIFVATTVIPIAPEPVALDVSDFDHEGRDDIVVVHADGSLTLINLINLEADPVTFNLTTLPSVIARPSDVIAAELDGDGGNLGIDVTILGSDSTGIGQLVTLLNQGGTGQSWAGLGNLRTVLTGAGQLVHGDIGDLDNDKTLLELVAIRDNGGLAALFENLGGGTGANWNGFGNRSDFDFGIDTVHSDIGDLDNDKDLDLVAVGRAGDDGSFAVILNDGTGLLGAPTVLPIGGEVGRMVLAGLDTDDDLDAAVIVDDPVDGPVVRVLRNDLFDSQLAFTISDDFHPDATPTLLLAGDLDLSGTEDLVVINDPDAPGGLPGSRGTGDDVEYLPFLSVSPPDCAVDLNGNGAADFFDVLTFLQAYTMEDPIADWNGDGRWDIFDMVLFIDAFSQGCP
ncbi:MAG: hypothetical protein D6695_04665 [Planctomycetota bacterium]|nr:MAG: hypothetical protein D6695_04665 [Planctomycetota bacterium]